MFARRLPPQEQAHAIERGPSDRDDRVVRVEAATPEAALVPSRGSLRGLDWFIFFLADVQTGFGPFVAVYLTTQKWTQVEIGSVLSIGSVVALLGQMPGGAIIDAAKSERLVAGLAIATIGCSALAYAAWPIFPVIAVAATLHAAASCVLGPAIAAISLGLVGPLAIGELAGLCGRDYSTVSRQISKLASLGLVARHAGATDARISSAALTARPRDRR